MRVSDRATARNYLKYLSKAQSNAAKTNQQIASGNRFEKLSDDVSAGTRVMRSRMDLSKAEKHHDNVKSIADELSVSETALTSVSEILSRARETVIKSQSEEKGEVGRKAVADEIKSMRQELVQLANTKYGNNYSFGGTNASMSAPFSIGNDGRMEYNGIPVDSIQKDGNGYFYTDNNNARQSIPMDEDVYLDVGLGIPMNSSQLDGDTGFKISFSGLDFMGFGTNQAGLSNNIYNVLVDLEANLRTYDADKVGKLNTQLTERADVFRGNLTDMGAKTKLLETMETRLKSQVDGFKDRINGLMGTDDKEAAISQVMNDYVLKAVLQIGAKIIPLSLMDFLR